MNAEHHEYYKQKQDDYKINSNHPNYQINLNFPKQQTVAREVHSVISQISVEWIQNKRYPVKICAVEIFGKHYILQNSHNYLPI